MSSTDFPDSNYRVSDLPSNRLPGIPACPDAVGVADQCKGAAGILAERREAAIQLWSELIGYFVDALEGLPGCCNGNVRWTGSALYRGDLALEKTLPLDAEDCRLIIGDIRSMLCLSLERRKSEAEAFEGLIQAIPIVDVPF